MRNFTKILIIFITFVSIAVAEPQKVQISLSHIKAIDLEEERGDEVYFSITEYASTGQSRQDRVPMFPLHWLSKNLSEIKDIVLWEKQVNDNDSYDVIISLIEHDTPPWNVDDHIGSVKVEIKNQAGKFNAEWKVADYFDQPVVIQKNKGVPEYTFKSDISEYNVKFDLVTN